MPDLSQPGAEIQEWQAHNYALALLLPYAPLLQLLEQGIMLSQIAAHYGVSTGAVGMRLKVTGL
jgi:Zn-dependent peptidase ImmA (M78 family)